MRTGLAIATLIVALAASGLAAERGAMIATLKDDGRTVSLDVGQELQVRLAANRTTGFEWRVTNAPEPVLVQDGEPTYKTDVTPGPRIGAGGTEIWHFRAAQKGRRTLRMEYRRPWEREVPAAAVLTLRIVVE